MLGIALEVCMDVTATAKVFRQEIFVSGLENPCKKTAQLKLNVVARLIAMGPFDKVTLIMSEKQAGCSASYIGISLHLCKQ